MTDKDEILEKISEAAELEGSELGEFWGYMVDLARYDYCFSPSFAKAFEKELKSIEKEIDENFEIVEEEEIVPMTFKKVKILREK